MNLDSIVADLKRERDRLSRAIEALEETSSRTSARKPRALSVVASTNGSGAKGPGRHLTPAGRKRLSEMMKKRWAERRRKGL
jgi:hypothetical protein